MYTISCDWKAEKIAKALQSCQNLETLTLDLKSTDLGYDDERREELLAERIALPKLHTLRLRRLDEETYKMFGPLLDTPSLKALDFNFRGLGGSVDLSDTHFWEAAASTVYPLRLAHLCLHGLKTTGDSIRALVEDIKSPLHLTLDKVEIDPSFFEDLITGDYLSDLRILELLNFPVEFNADTIHTLIKTREMDFRAGWSTKYPTTLTLTRITPAGQKKSPP